jgi:hypothetical protein
MADERKVDERNVEKRIVFRDSGRFALYNSSTHFALCAFNS